jgi:hypothetical protein
MKLRRYVLALACTAGIAACHAVQVAPPASEQIEYGRFMYQRKCQTCHELYDPREFTRASLTRALHRYAARAGLKREDRPYVHRYLQANAKDAPPIENDSGSRAGMGLCHAGR